MSASNAIGKSAAATLILICPHPSFKVAEIASKKSLRWVMDSSASLLVPLADILFLMEFSGVSPTNYLKAS